MNRSNTVITGKAFLSASKKAPAALPASDHLRFLLMAPRIEQEEAGAFCSEAFRQVLARRYAACANEKGTRGPMQSADYCDASRKSPPHGTISGDTANCGSIALGL